MATYTITRNGKTVLSGSYRETSKFFFKLYFFLLLKCWSRDEVMEVIRGSYTLYDNLLGRASDIYC